jgi:hypothetical protein
MRNKLILIGLCFFQLSLISLNYPREVLEYVESFNSYAQSQVIQSEQKSRLGSVKVSLGSLNEFYGACLYSSKEVIIDSSHFSNLKKGARQRVIDHEMGHCVLGRVHSFQTDQKGNPFSVMSLKWSGIKDQSLENSRLELFKLSEQGKLPYQIQYSYEMTGNILSIPDDLAMRFDQYDLGSIQLLVKENSQNETNPAFSSPAFAFVIK